MYEFHGQLGPAPVGEEPRGWRDTITGGSGESGETLKKALSRLHHKILSISRCRADTRYLLSAVCPSKQERL